MTIQDDFLIDRISGYFDHSNEWEYLAAIEKDVPLERLFSALAEMIDTGEPQQVHHAGIFIRDMVLVNGRALGRADPFGESEVLDGDR